jgi:phospholipid/cholesterol/gamma-HCH transport system substrate-binding protein
MRNEIKIGIFATITLIVLYLGFNYLKGNDVFSKTFTYYAEFDEATGLTNASPVYFKGFKVGSIKGLSFDDKGTGRIRARIDVYYDLKVTEGSTATIFSTDFLGGRGLRIKVNPNSTAILPEKGILLTGKELSLTESINPLKDKASVLIGKIDTLVANLNVLTGQTNQKSISKTIENAEQLSKKLDDLVGKESARLDAILASIESISKNLQHNNGLITSILTNANAVSDSLAKTNIKGVIASAKSSLDEASSLLKKINEGQGTLGQLVKDDRLYTNLTNSAKSFDSLMVDLKAHPKRYVHFSLFGKKSK